MKRFSKTDERKVRLSASTRTIIPNIGRESALINV